MKTLGVLIHVSEHYENKKLLVECGIFDIMTLLLQNKNGAIVREAAAIIGNILHKPAGMVELLIL